MSIVQFKFLFGSEVSAKVCVFLLLPLASLIFTADDLASMSFFVNAIQALLPALGLGFLALLPLSEFKNKDSFYTLFFMMLGFLIVLNIIIYFLFSLAYAFILPASICSLLVFAGQFHLLNDGKVSTFIALYFYRFLLPASILILFIVETSDKYIAYIAIYTMLTLVTLIFTIARKSSEVAFTFSFDILKNAFLKYKVYLPVIFNSAVAFFFLYYPKTVVNDSESNTILLISFAQYIQSFYLIFFITFVRSNLSEIYRCAELDDSPLAQYLSKNLFYLLLVIMASTVMVLSLAVLVFERLDFLLYALAYLILVFFQVLYVASNDYLIAKGKGSLLSCLLLCSVLGAYFSGHFISVEDFRIAPLVPLVFNALFFLGAYCLAFYQFGPLRLTKDLVMVAAMSMIAIAVGSVVADFPVICLICAFAVTAVLAVRMRSRLSVG